MTQAIKPSEVAKTKSRVLPKAVLDVFNRLIALNYTNGKSKVLQKDVVSALEAEGIGKHEIFARNYLNVEEIYMEAGWGVYYDKPSYCENYDAYFEFKG